MTIEQVYNDWRNGLKSPDDSIFYYHPNLDRIILGLAIYALSSRPLIQKVGYKPMELLNIYIRDLVMAWIDDNGASFETMFRLTMPVAEMYVPALRELERQKPSKKRAIRKLIDFYGFAVSTAGDMSFPAADDLLDDLSTDGKMIYSDKIKAYGADLLKEIQIYGSDVFFS